LLLSTVLVALGGLSLGAALARALAVSFPVQLNPLFDLPAAAALAITVAGLALLGWQQLSHRFARRAERPPADILAQDALAHLPLLLLLPYLCDLVTVTLFAGSPPLDIGEHLDMTHNWVLPSGALVLFIALRVHHAVTLGVITRARADRTLHLALFAIPFALYVRTLTPGVGTKDGFELQVVSATLGIAHPTGYPLFTLLGKLFITLVPLGSPAYRINLMCALFAALCVPLIYAVGRRVLKRRATAALAALTFAFTPAFWTQASIPEKYTLNVWFVALVIYLAIRWTHEMGERKVRWFYWLAFAYGLSLTHHRTMLLLAPGLALYALLAEPGLVRQPKRLLIALGLFAAPLLLYLYIPWRAHVQGWEMTWPEFMQQISGSEYAPALRLDEWLTNAGRRATYLRFLRNQFGHLGMGLGVIGWLSLLRPRRRFALFSIATWMAYVIFGIGYHAYYNDVNFFLPSHLVFALWIGAGLGALAGVAAATARRLRSSFYFLRLGAIGYWTLAALLPLGLVWTYLPQVDMSQAQNDLPWAEHVLNLDLPPRATILADSVKMAPLHYLTTVEKVRPDVNAVVLPDETAYVKALEAHLAQGLPVYLARYLPNLGGAYHLRALGPLVEVSLSPLTGPPPLAYPVEATLGDGIHLLGFDAPTLAAPRQGTLHVTLYWQPTVPITKSYHVRLRLVGSSRQIWWEEKGRLPVNDHYPTNAWRPGEVIPDYHEIPIRATLQPGNYRLEAGLFLPFAETGLPVDGKLADRVVLGTVTVMPTWLGRPPQPMKAQQSRVTPHLMLIGVDAPEHVWPGTRARLRLHWLVLGPLPDYQFSLVLCGESQTSTSLESSWYNEYATSAWPTGEIMVTQHAIDVPTDLAGQSCTLNLHLETQDEFISPKVAKFRIKDASITGQEASVNFGDQMLLLNYDTPRKEFHSGDIFEMTINWQGVADMDEDYTVFVHLLGPDGLSHGQVDVWPQDGTYPTSTWPVGEVIADTYRVPLDADAPLGVYRVEVGVYLLRTMRRLPVLNADGHAVDDKLLIEGFSVGQ
jgi:hypothetical protein